MSDFAHPIPIVHYTQLSDLFQEVVCPSAGLTSRMVRVEPHALLVSRRTERLTLPLLALGVLVTALNQEGHLLTAWLIADQYQPQMANTGRKAQAEARQAQLAVQVKAAAQARGLTVLPGYYAVPDSAFRCPASFPAAVTGEEGN
jgi:hypothetical protein